VAFPVRGAAELDYILNNTLYLEMCRKEGRVVWHTVSLFLHGHVIVNPGIDR
jgi:hypothetical protein